MKTNVLHTILLLALISLSVGILRAQCRTEESWAEAWQSCETSPNPHSAYSEGHWLWYDFGHVYPVSSLHIWNLNQPAHLQQGVKRLAIDYSLDGQTWQSWGEVEVPQASGKARDSGSEVADVGMIPARYVLLTVLENWGDPHCVGLHEVMFDLEPIPIETEAAFVLYPNPSQERVNIALRESGSGRYQVEMINLTGQQVASQTVERSGNQDPLRMEFPQIQAGMYIVRVFSEMGEILGAEKLIIRE
ncbi:MAG: T9SS type A sorting domain-containing protein [Bacteroidota bacterium]